MTDLLDTIITVLQLGFAAVVAANLAGGLLGGGGLRGLFGKGFKGLKAGAGAFGAKAMSRARGFKGPISSATGRPNMRFKSNQLQRDILADRSALKSVVKGSDDAVALTKNIAKNKKLQGEILEQTTKRGVGKLIPGLNALVMAGELGYNVHEKGLAEGTVDTLKSNKYALAGAGVGAGLTAWSGPGALFGAGGGFLIGSGLDLLSSFTGGWAKGGTIPRSGIGLVGERGPELVAMSKGSQVVPNHYLGGYADGQFGMVNMKETNDLLAQTIGLLSTVAANTQGAADGIKNINLRSGD